MTIGRNLLRFNLKYNTPQSLLLTNLFVSTGAGVTPSTSLNVVFTPTDAISQNSNQWCLLTTFKTTDYYNNLKSELPAIDADYNSLYLSGVTAIAIYDPTNTFLSQYQASSLDISTRFVNGASWYAKYGISFQQLMASGVVKFLYAGQIPYKVRAQSPFTVSQDQIDENVQVRRQKKLMQEYYRAKGQVASYQGYQQVGPYPDNGLYVDNSLSAGAQVKYTKSVVQKPYFKWYAPQDPAQSVIYNQPLGYTDVGTGRPLPTPL